jgi:hypothetical protein
LQFSAYFDSEFGIKYTTFSRLQWISPAGYLFLYMETGRSKTQTHKQQLTALKFGTPGLKLEGIIELFVDQLVLLT